SQPPAAQGWTTPDWVSPPNTTRRSAARTAPQDADTTGSVVPSLVERRALAAPVQQDSGERSPAAPRSAERRPVEQNSVERRPVDQDSVERGPTAPNSVERKPAEQNSAERSATP